MCQEVASWQWLLRVLKSALASALSKFLILWMLPREDLLLVEIHLDVMIRHQRKWTRKHLIVLKSFWGFLYHAQDWSWAVGKIMQFLVYHDSGSGWYWIWRSTKSDLYAEWTAWTGSTARGCVLRLYQQVGANLLTLSINFWNMFSENWGY